MKINDTKKHLKMTRLYGFMYEPKANLSLGLEILTDMWLVKNGTYQAIICIYINYCINLCTIIVPRKR